MVEFSAQDHSQVSVNVTIPQTNDQLRTSLLENNYAQKQEPTYAYPPQEAPLRIQKLTKSTNLLLTQLAADLLAIISQGEKSAEIIRKVLFELPDFAAFQLYQEIKNGPKIYTERTKQMAADGSIQEYPRDPRQGGTDYTGIEDRSLFVFFTCNLQPGTLKSEISEKQCTFLVNLMTDNNQSVVSYEQFLDFIIPRTKKKITRRLISKIKQTQKPLRSGKIPKSKYDAVCSLAKLFECEIQVMKKIQRQIAKFHQKQRQQALDLQIAQLFQALDMRGSGKLTRKQLKGILNTHGRQQAAGSASAKQTFVCDNDINAIMRRMDADGDEAISFSDYFTSLLPYFIYGDLQKRPTMNQVVGKALKEKHKTQSSKMKKLNSQSNRAVSASAAQRRKPSYGQPNFFQKNSSLLQDSDLEEDEYLQLRGNAENKHQYRESMARSSSQNQLKTLFSQHDPQLYFHKSPACNKVLPNLNKDHQPSSPYAVSNTMFSANKEGGNTEFADAEEAELGHKRRGIQSMTSEQVKHKLYVQPLMKFFHDCIDFERTIEIDKQELILQEDYSIYNVFKALIGPGKKFLLLCDLQAILARNFNMRFSYSSMKLAMQRQFPIDAENRVEQMRYTDFLDLVKPKNPEFQSYVNRRMRESEIGYSFQPNLGLCEASGQKFAQLFEDIIRLENDLELQRQYKIPQINLTDLYRSIDKEMKGFCTLHDYFAFFESSYCEDLPVSTEEITYLFKRHDRERQGRVTEADLRKELTPLQNIDFQEHPQPSHTPSNIY